MKVILLEKLLCIPPFESPVLQNMSLWDDHKGVFSSVDETQVALDDLAALQSQYVGSF